MKKGEAAIYQYLLHSVAADYETVCVMKTGPRGSVLLLQNKQNGKRLVFRRYEGSGEVYQKLLPISCPYLPQIMEVAGENGRVAVLEEYIEGDSLAELLRGARFTAAEAREITWQLCQALRASPIRPGPPPPSPLPWGIPPLRAAVIPPLVPPAAKRCPFSFGAGRW